jgi:hypothetical protein
LTVKSGKSVGTVTVTPSGIPVYYQSEPKRLYRIGYKTTLSADSPALLGAAQAEDTDWVEVPSVTTVLGVLDKPALPWWGMKVGAEGVMKLHNLGLVKSTVMPGGLQPVLACPTIIERQGTNGKLVRELDFDNWIVAGVEQLVTLLNMHKLTTNHVKRQAGDRGQAVHDAFELWAREGYMPDPQMFPPTESGYVAGLVAFLKDVPSAEPEGCEILVASSEYGYAGRYDLRLRTHAEHKVVVHRTPVGGPQYRMLPPARLLTDLKTSKGVYPSHAKQLEMYEQASLESGYEPTDARGILHVSAEGEYEFVRSWATFEDALTTLREYQQQEEMEARRRELGIQVVR